MAQYYANPSVRPIGRKHVVYDNHEQFERDAATG
jgi:hypothetical protein